MTTYTEDEIEPTDQAEPEAFHIDSEERANWFLRKLANIEAEQDRIVRQSQAMIADLNREHNRLTGRFLGELQEWARQHLPRGKRSLRLFQGTLQFRKVGATVRVADVLKAQMYAAQQPETFADCWQVNLRPAAYREIAEAVLRETGEVLPGIETTPERESFSIKFGGKD